MASPAQPKPTLCPKCGSNRTVSNASYPTKTRGIVHRRICRGCGNTWKEYDIADGLFTGLRIHDTEPSVLQSFALVALRVQLDQVEWLTGQKSETIQDRLLGCFEKAEIWRKVTARLNSAYHIQPGEIKALSQLLNVIKSGTGTFHAARSELRQKPGSRAGRGKEDRELVLQIFKRDGLSEREFEIFWEKHLRTSNVPIPKQVQAARQKLAQRIADVLGCAIVPTPAGHFYRLDDDPRLNQWISKVQRFDTATRPAFLERLTSTELSVFEQVQNPCAQALLRAKLEGARGRRRGEPWPEIMTVNCLAEGMGLDLDLFIDSLRSIVVLLTKSNPATGSSQQKGKSS